MYDLLLRNGYVVDPVNNIKGRKDIAIEGKSIVRVDCEITARAKEEIDLEGKTVMPGIIDTHVHLCGSGLENGYKMLAKAGVATAIDFFGQAEGIARGIQEKGAGINVAFLGGMTAQDNLPGIKGLSGCDCSEAELDEAIERAVGTGALGVKILGGHYPLTPETTSRIIELCNTKGVYVAFHAGTTETKGKSFPAFLEALQLAGDNRLHLAHINTYCAGETMDYLDEMRKAIELLDQKQNIISESYLAVINGTFGKCANGIPLSMVTRTSLRKGGYEQSEKGLEKAIADKYAQVCVEENGLNVLKTGEAGLRYWKEKNTETMVSFNQNPPINSIAFAMHKDGNGEFTVDAISTDGGGIPRNKIVELGLPLTRYEDFTLEDFVMKTSVNPARMFGFKAKGSLGAGMDADITVVDMERCIPVMAVACGKVVMREGRVTGEKGRIIITERAEKYCKNIGISYDVI